MSVQCTNSGDTLSRAETVIGGTTARTISCWVRKTTGSDNAFLEILYGGGTWGTSFSTFAGDMYIGEYSNVTSQQYIFTFATNTWYHIVHIYDGTNASIYINGALVAGPTAWNSSGAPSGSSWNFGQSNVELQDVCVYNAALSAAEAAQLYVSRRPRRTNNLQGYYPFFAGSNRTIDYSGNGRTLTSAGSPSDGADSAPAGWGGADPRTFVQTSSVVELAGTGGVQTAGSANISAQKDLSGSGGVQTAGSATLAVQKDEAGSGGVQTAGSATVTVTKAMTASGGVQTSGAGVLTGGSLGPILVAKTAAATRRGAVLFGSRRRIR